MSYYKSLKYQIYPNETQKEQIDKTINCARYVYNYYLAKRIDVYEKTHKQIRFYAMDLDLSRNLKKEKEWLREVDAYALSESLKNLDHAFNQFFNKRCKFPSFKKKKGSIEAKKAHVRNRLSYTTRYRAFVCDDNKHIRLPKVGLVRARGYKQYPKDAHCANIVITKTQDGKYYAIVATEFEDYTEEKEKRDSTGKVVGIDLGIRNLVATSDEEIFKNPRFMLKSKKKMYDLKRALKRKPSDSRNREKICIKISKLNQHIVNQRSDYIHKVAHHLVKNYDVIFMEDLKISELLHEKMGNKMQEKIIREGLTDSGLHHMMSAIIDRIKRYKNKFYFKIPRTYPSSKICNCCGYSKINLPINRPSWVCPICKTKHDRDINAAKNICAEGIRLNIENLVDFDLKAYSHRFG